VENEALRGHARLPHVGHLAEYRSLKCEIHVGIVKNDERVAAAQLQNGLFRIAASTLRHLRPAVIAAGE
jgi:hypothetical protein